MSSKEECLKQMRDVIDGVLSTVDADGNPQSRVIDIMHIDDETAYFLTARGKDVYREIINHPQISYLNFKDNKSVRVTGTAEKLDDQKKWIDLMFEENSYMNNVYPGQSRYILEPFKITDGEIEFFDLTKKPILRQHFTIGNGKITKKGFEVTDTCISCGICIENCPQKAIIMMKNKSYIKQPNCLHCGLCYENCPVQAIKRINE